MTKRQDCPARLGIPDRILFLAWESKIGRILRLAIDPRQDSVLQDSVREREKKDNLTYIDLRMTAGALDCLR